jgi:hypothetical protein
MIRRPIALIALLAVLAVSACTQPGPAPEPASPTPSPDPVPEPAWTELTLDRSILPASPPRQFGPSLDAVAGLPAVVGGGVADAGSLRPVVWYPTPDGLGAPQFLDVSQQAGTVTAATTDGSRSLLAGDTWTDQLRVPFVFTSDDRTTWRRLDFPQAAREAGMSIGQVVLAPQALNASVDEAALRVANLDTGAVVTLPSPPEGQFTDVAALTMVGDIVLLLATAVAPDGTSTMSGFRSADGGATWEQTEAPHDPRAQISEMIPVQAAVMAVGSVTLGSTSRANVWLTGDGSVWTGEWLPDPATPTDGWSTWFTGVAAVNGVVYAAVHQERELYSSVLVRTPPGGFQEYARTGDWLSPGVSTHLVGLTSGLLTLRQWQGQAQVGLIDESGQFQVLEELPDSATPAGTLSHAGVIDGQAYLFANRTTVAIGEGWHRTQDVTAYRIEGEQVVPAQWMVPNSSALTGLSVATSPDGQSVLLGTMVTMASGQPDGTDVVGWSFAADGTAQGATGLGAERTESVYDVAFTGDGWVAVGADREFYAGINHRAVAVWTSADGLTWQREHGPFDPDPAWDSAGYDACALPGGELLVVGWLEDAYTDGFPLAFLFSQGEWRRLDLAGLGSGVTSLTDCVSTGTQVIVQGRRGGHDQAWTTTDATTFTALAIGAAHDGVGAIETFPGGLAAAGTVVADLRNQAVVWLSADGASWISVDLPVTSNMSTAYIVLPWGDRLVVPYLTQVNPGVAVLDNPAELLGQ